MTHPRGTPGVFALTRIMDWNIIEKFRPVSGNHYISERKQR
jgi:hypothetical protein